MLTSDLRTTKKVELWRTTVRITSEHKGPLLRKEITLDDIVREQLQPGAE